MTTLIYRKKPRALAIKPAGSDFSLILTTDKENNCVATYSTASKDFNMLHMRTIFGCIGLVTLNSETFVGIITQVAKVFCVFNVGLYFGVAKHLQD